MIARLMSLAAGVCLIGGAAVAQPAAPDVQELMRIYGATPQTVPKQGETLFFPLSNGLLGAAMPANRPSEGANIDWKQFMTGGAYAMRSDPAQGPFCRRNRMDRRHPKIEFWSLDVDPAASRLVVNQASGVGAAFLHGKLTHYIQSPTWCDDGTFEKSGETAVGHLWAPFNPAGQSPRNFQAMGLAAAAPGGIDTGGGRGIDTTPDAVRDQDRLESQGPGPGQGRFSMARFTPVKELLGGYADRRLLGHSQAIGEMAGGETALAAIRQATAGAPAQVASIPGMLPGAKSEGALELMLANKIASDLRYTGTSQVAPIVYLHARVVHTGEPVRPSREYLALQDQIASEAVTVPSQQPDRSLR